METLFRLALARPAIAQDPALPSIVLAQNTPFQAALRQALQAPDPRAAVRAAALQFAQSAAYSPDPSSHPMAAGLANLAAGMDVLEARPRAPHADLLAAIRAAFNANAGTLVQRQAFRDAMAALRDTIVAIKHLPGEHGRPLEQLTRQLRDMETVVRAAGDATFPGTGAILRRYRRRSLQLPTEADLRSALSTTEAETKRQKELEEEEKRRRQRLQELLARYRGAQAAIDELASIGSQHLQTTPRTASAGFLGPSPLRPRAALQDSVTFRNELARLTLDRLRDKTPLTAAVETHRGLLSSTVAGLTAAAPGRQLLAGTRDFRPPVPAAGQFRPVEGAERSLSQQTREVLREHGLRLSDQPLDTTVQALQNALSATAALLDASVGRAVQTSLKRIGGALVLARTPLFNAWNNISVGGGFQIPPIPFPPDPRIPHTRGRVGPAGVADLIVVRQQLVRYEATDVAHIENVLRGESKDRQHRRRRETEELTFRETEVSTTEERELESTNRFELSRETSETIQEEASLKAGLTVSGKYGPVVEFSASAEGSVSRSKEQATSAASTFSQDITQRSAHKVTERVLERASLRVTNEVVEENRHTLDNSGGAGHISGVYQWVNKVYQAQMFNYGLRTLYDFMVPEPGAFLIAAMQNAHASAIQIEKPAPFPLRPDEITPSNYSEWVHRYGAGGVEPPPEIFITRSLDFKAGGGEEHVDYTHSGQITIDEGYEAIWGSVAVVNMIWEGTWVVDVALGSQVNRFAGGDWLWTTTLDSERGSIPFALATNEVSDIAVAVEVKCRRTNRATDKWRLETHGKIMDAYRARLADYEEKIAALEAQAGIAIRGRNPGLNLELMKDELKKDCISILTAQHYDLFGAIGSSSAGLPQIDLSESDAEGRYVRFFEQAFEWEHMTWITYPYFWGRKSQWAERISYEDEDPRFNQFLKAGYCRVVVPARLGFEGAIDHFMTTGDVWQGGPLPPISNPLYLPIADEIAEQLDRPGDEQPQGAPWLVRIPTTLVRLRPDDRLPVWAQDANGDWVEQ
jgi:hypothetical protein